MSKKLPSDFQRKIDNTPLDTRLTNRLSKRDAETALDAICSHIAASDVLDDRLMNALRLRYGESIQARPNEDFKAALKRAESEGFKTARTKKHLRIYNKSQEVSA